MVVRSEAWSRSGWFAVTIASIAGRGRGEKQLPAQECRSESRLFLGVVLARLTHYRFSAASNTLESDRVKRAAKSISKEH